jgi:hypothetical protein
VDDAMGYRKQIMVSSATRSLLGFKWRDESILYVSYNKMLYVLHSLMFPAQKKNKFFLS